MKKAEALWLSKVADSGCIVCLNNGYEGTIPEIHHIRHGVGAGQRNDNYHVLPICPVHHRTGGHGVALHAGKSTWEAINGTEMELYHQLLESMGVADAQSS